MTRLLVVFQGAEDVVSACQPLQTGAGGLGAHGDVCAQPPLEKYSHADEERA